MKIEQIMGILSHSTTICRICGLHSDHTVNIFEQKGLQQDLTFYLPLEVSCHILTTVVNKAEFEIVGKSTHEIVTEETILLCLQMNWTLLIF